MTCIWKFFIKLCLHIMVFIKFLPFIIVRLLVYWLRKDQLNFQNYIHNTTTTTCSFGNNNSDPEMYSFCFWFKREKKWCDMVFTAKTDMEYELDFLQSILVFLCVCIVHNNIQWLFSIALGTIVVRNVGSLQWRGKNLEKVYIHRFLWLTIRSCI